MTAEGQRGRQKTKSENIEVLRKKLSTKDEHNVPFNMRELSTLTKRGTMVPGQARICYSMLKHQRRFEEAADVI